MSKVSKRQFNKLLNTIEDSKLTLDVICENIGFCVSNLDEEQWFELNSNVKCCSKCGTWVDVCCMNKDDLCDDCEMLDDEYDLDSEY